MKLVMNMVRKPFKAGEVIFDISEKSDDLYLIHTGTVHRVTSNHFSETPFSSDENCFCFAPSAVVSADVSQRSERTPV